MEDAYQYLKGTCGIKEDEILIDITGGQKVTTISGAIVALGAGRCFQYISTTDYSIKTYDIDYEAL